MLDKAKTINLIENKIVELAVKIKLIECDNIKNSGNFLCTDLWILIE